VHLGESFEPSFHDAEIVENELGIEIRKLALGSRCRPIDIGEAAQHQHERVSFLHRPQGCRVEPSTRPP
jgi:hypothetical protein